MTIRWARRAGTGIKAGVMRNAADKAARAEAEAVIQRWNGQLALGRDMLWSPRDLGGPARWHAVARCVLPRLWQKGDDNACTPYGCGKFFSGHSSRCLTCMGKMGMCGPISCSLLE
jgi:hypothetical protein